MPDRIAAELLELLDTERAALHSCAFDVLDELAERKRYLIQTLGNNAPDPATIRNIRKRLQDNQALLAAAITGVKAASDRIAALQKVRSGLDVYDQTGQLNQVSAVPPGMEKKA